MSILERERETYEAVWSGVPAYRNHSPGLESADRFLEMSGATSGTVLDAGCGAGVGGLELSRRGFDVALCDVTNAGLSPEAETALPFVTTCLWNQLYPVAYLAKVQLDWIGRVHQQDACTFNYVYCCDVMEHIPTEYTMLTLSRLFDVADRGVFLSISTVPDAFGVWVGKPLHQTVRPFQWWRDRLSDFGTVSEARDVINAGIYWVTT